MQEYVSFSDGSPILELSVFLAFLLTAALLMFLPAVRGQMNRATAWIIAVVKGRNALPLGGVEFEMFKLDAVRIAVGAIATWRYGDILAGSLQSGNSNAIALSGVATLAAACIAIGLFTRLFSLFLMATANTIIDNYLGASTLGSMVMSMILLMFAIAPAGRTLSLDALIFRKRETSTDQIVIAKLAALLAYYGVCLYSVSWHTHDEAWMSLSIIGWVLLSSAANPKYSGLAWQLYEWSPWIFVNFVRLSIIGMLAWYVLVLPGLFLGWVTRQFVILWGLAFFLISALVLPLSYLGWYELLLWAALFIPPFRPGWTARKTPHTSGGLGVLSGALAVTLVAMVCLFLVRLPVASISPDNTAPASWSKQLAGAAPAALGIHKINVFNEQDLAVFAFRWANYTAPGDIDLATVDFADLDAIPSDRVVMTDTIRYGIARHSRRVSRQNIGCDREYFQSIIPQMKAMFRNPESAAPITHVVSARWISITPTSEDFASYKPPVRGEFPICRAYIDLEKGELIDLVFLQAGVDEKLRREGIPQILDSQHLEAVLNYSCGDDGRFLWALASSRPEAQDPQNIKQIMSVTGQVYGRFAIECFMEVRDMIEGVPQLLSDQFDATQTTCDAGIVLLNSLDIALAKSPEINLGADIAAAVAGREAGQYKPCIDAALKGRSTYWQAVTL